MSLTPPASSSAWTMRLAGSRQSELGSATGTSQRSNPDPEAARGARGCFDLQSKVGSDSLRDHVPADPRQAIELEVDR